MPRFKVAYSPESLQEIKHIYYTANPAANVNRYTPD